MGPASPRTIELPGHTARIAPSLLGHTGEIAQRVAPAHRYVIVTDDTVAALHLEGLRRSFQAAGVGAGDLLVATFPAGEPHKTRETWARLTDAMITAGCGRDTSIIALGGGVVGDLAGFVAATYMRGISWLQVPTTLLAMVDASVGGKTGVDTPNGKNLVGAFHQPAAVVVDPVLLATLPVAHRRNGLAEVLKHGIIADERHLTEALSLAPAFLHGSADPGAIAALVGDSIAIKADVVRRDEREGGVRKILNFGHTIGHAVEAASNYSLLHGEAIAIGMTLEARLAERLAVAEPGLINAVRSAMEIVGLPTALPPGIDASRLLELMRTDKKVRAGRLAFALPRRVGLMAGADTGWAIAVDDREILAVLDA